MLISSAYAQSAGGADGGSTFIQFLPLILIFVVFYFLLIRPQQKRMKEHREMVAALRRGDRIVTGGGVIGEVTRVTSDTEVQVEIADGVRVQVLKNTVQQVLSKTEPAEGEQTARNQGGGETAEGPAGKIKNAAGKLLGGNRESSK